MNAELFFIYDSHCPWSYATTALVNNIQSAFPEMSINLFHCARYEGDELISTETINAVSRDSTMTFNDQYKSSLSKEKDSTLAANILSWVQVKVPHLALPLLNAIQTKHFEEAVEFTTQADFDEIITQLKLSPPNKVFNNTKLTKDAEVIIHEIFELQDIINTTAIPALLLAVNDNLILLNHNLYLTHPESIVEAVKLELNP